MEEWESELERLGGSVRPDGPVGAPLVERVRRRRGRRRTAGVVLGAASVAAVVVSASLVGSVGSSSEPAPVAPSVSEVSTAPPTPELFTCPFEDDQPPAPPIADLDEQQELARAAREPRPGFTVTATRSSPVGVLALVDGDLTVAREALGELGVLHVWQDRGSAPIVNWVTDPVLESLRRQYGARPGSAGWGVWDDAGQVIVSWQAPVPPEIAALAGRRSNGVVVVVRERRYSSAELLRAGDRSPGVLASLGLRSSWVLSGSCDDGSGLVVGMDPAPSDLVAVQEKLSDELGMPVAIERQERPSPR